MPLKAIIDEKDFYAWNLTESDRKKEFFCPICNAKFSVVLPKQSKRIKYFRHLVGQAHQENETEEHVKGKLKIIEIASKLGLKWHLEHQIGKHVTDVYIEGEQPLAIEFQCSKCNSAEIAEREETYANNGVAVFWILGANFYKNFQKKTRTKIERAIENIHPTVYFTEDKFTVCRCNSAYECFVGYNRQYFETPQLRLVEDFDIDWHLTNFVKNKLTVDNPSLLFRWMIPEKPTPEPPIVPKPTPQHDKVAFKKIEPRLQERRYPAKIIEPSAPVWIVKRIPPTKMCDCRLRYSVYKATREIMPNKVLDKTVTTITKCEVCLAETQKVFSNAIWKYAKDSKSKSS